MKPEERILAKLDSCAPYHAHLVALRDKVASPEAGWLEWGALERYLHLAIECAIDVGEMVISWKGLERPEENRDVFRVLREAGHLDADLAERMMRAAGLRNLLVHQYGRVDRDALRRVVQHDLGDLEEFAKRMAVLASGTAH